MQAPATLNLTMYQGASFDYNLVWNTTEGTVTTPVNLTNWSARMQVRNSYDASEAALSLTSGTGITLGGTAGSILIEATATQTATILAGPYVYDLEMVSPASVVTRLVEGTIIVDPEVTR
jgi:hypothetical protein